eukprot:2997889-Pyramimonas_sp.AAC.1
MAVAVAMMMSSDGAPGDDDFFEVGIAGNGQPPLAASPAFQQRVMEMPLAPQPQASAAAVEVSAAVSGTATPTGAPSPATPMTVKTEKVVEWTGPSLATAKKNLSAKVGAMIKDVDGKKGALATARMFIAAREGCKLEKVTEEMANLKLEDHLKTLDDQLPRLKTQLDGVASCPAGSFAE